MTSDFEGFGMVLIEAQSYGVVPIAFNCFSSIDQIILNEKSGKIIDDFDIDNYQKELEKLLTTSSLDDFAAEAINHANTFEKSIIAEKWLNQFES
jgi:glycosyltransferase involved in cell wall biosynthesis